MIKGTACFFLVCFIAFTQFSCKHEIPAAPIVNPADTTVVNGVCFETEILPIFLGNCAIPGCHDAGTRSEEYQLDSYANIVARGIVPGNAANSKIQQVLLETGSGRMPQDPNMPLTVAQINLITTWINEGARNTAGCAVASCDSSQFTYSGNVQPIIQTHCIGCHSGVALNGGYIGLDTYDGLREQALFGALYGSITHTGPHPMPQNGSKISDCKIAIIRNWILAGAPNN